jgi:hypothetical protein
VQFDRRELCSFLVEPDLFEVSVADNFWLESREAWRDKGFLCNAPKVDGLETTHDKTSVLQSHTPPDIPVIGKRCRRNKGRQKQRTTFLYGDDRILLYALNLQL